MVAALHNLSLVHHDDLVGILYGTQAMRADHHRTSFVETMQIVHDVGFIGGIERIGRLVEENILRILVDGTGYQDALPLSLAHPLALHADDGVIAQRKRKSSIRAMRAALFIRSLSASSVLKAIFPSMVSEKIKLSCITEPVAARQV